MTKNELLAKGKPKIVDFWATWCGPCKMVLPIIDELKDEYKDKVEVHKFDVDDNASLAGEFGIMSVPTVLLVNENGEIVETLTGFNPKQVYVDKLDKLLEV